MHRTASAALLIFALVVVAGSVLSASSTDDNGIDFVLIHPPFAESYSCSEHWDGQLQYLGDSLGADCVIGRMVDDDGRLWMRQHRGAGLENQDWYGYGANVLAPCDCTIEKTQANPVENRPGELGKPPASMIVFRRSDDTLILYAHVKDSRVSEGDQVAAGDVVASVGNNGYSRLPHIHIGAWREEVALQIRFDQKRMQPDSE